MSNNSTALITGASAGIGEQLAHVFAEYGHNLILVARRQAQLDALAQELRDQHRIEVKVIAADLAADGAVSALAESLAGIPVDILVNNAGVLSSGSFKHMPDDSIDNMLRLNVLSLTRLCRQFIQPMVDRGQGRVLNVASIAAFQSVPNLAVYAATKAYVLNLSEALSVELADKGVTVTTLCPGYTDTAMLRGPVASGSAKIAEFTILSPERVARDGYKACMAGDAIKVPGIGYAAAMATSRLIPRWVLRRIAKMATGAPSR